MQFSLRSLFVVVTVAALLCAALFALPGGIGLIVLGLCSLSVTPACIAGVIYGRGKIRAFAIGCLTTGWWISFVGFYYAIVLMFSGDADELFSAIGSADEGTIYYKIGWVVLMAWVCFSGLVCVGVRWLVRPTAASENSFVVSRRVAAEASPVAPTIEAVAASSAS